MSKTWDVKSEYFSGQGVLLIGKYDSNGKVGGLRPIGNVPELTLGIEEETTDHKESQSGQRATDLRLTTEVGLNVNFTLEDFKKENLAVFLRGDGNNVKGASISNRAATLYKGLVTALPDVSIDNVIIRMGADTLTPYVDEITPYDYDVNNAAGSIRLNDGSNIPADKIAKPVTTVTVGTTTVLEVENDVQVGDYITLSGFAGADADAINDVSLEVTARTATEITVALDTSGLTITVGTASLVLNEVDVTIDYDFSDYEVVEAMTQGAGYYFLRFEGLNTVNENKSQVVNIWRFSASPLAELALISDEVQSTEVEGSALADTSRPEGSRYFTIKKQK